MTFWEKKCTWHGNQRDLILHYFVNLFSNNNRFFILLKKFFEGTLHHTLKELSNLINSMILLF